ncbi:MAG: hypothetical protein IJ568_06270 [Bacilli bacterium]|nr:hypothetical protein [Bacilli bacterium]
MSEEKIYQFNEYVLGYDKSENDRSALIISKVLNGNMYVMAELYDGSADVISMILDRLNKELQQKENIIKEVREYIMTELITEWDIKNDGYVSGSDLPVDAITPILEIIDKEE